MAETISITICGDGGCGKSSITLRLVRSQWTHEYDPTIEDSYSVTRTVDGLPYSLALTDTAGQEEYRGLWAATNLNSDAFLLVYDITNGSTLETLDYFMDMIDMNAENRKEKNTQLFNELGKVNSSTGEPLVVGMAPPVKIVAGNKCDLRDARDVSARAGLEYARKRGCGFMETSAREMVNIEETFQLIVRRVVEARRQYRQQQFLQLNQLSPRPHPSTQSGQPLFPTSLLSKAQAISHSRTPPLTAEERKLSDSVPNQGDKPPAEQNQWLGLGRAFSQRVAKLKKSSATALRGDASRSNGPRVGEEDTEGEGIARARQRSKSVQHEKSDIMSRYPAKSLAGQNAHGPVKASWWRRILCS